MPKISVIIPVYNVEKYLRECLNSIVNQTIKDIEIICVDDGSTDGSLDILNEYSSNDDRFTIVIQDNKGPSAARNEGIKLASGDYIAFIDSDDYLFNNDYFEKLYNACEKYNADIAVAGIIRGNNKKTYRILKIENEKVATEYEDKLRICDVPDSNYVWNKLYKKSAWLDAELYFPEKILYEDVYITCQLLYKFNKLVSVPNIEYFYRKHKNSIIKIHNSKIKNDKSFAEKIMYDFLKNHNIKIENFASSTKKYRVCGITFFKSTIKNNICKNVLFNFIKWSYSVKTAGRV